MGLLFGVPAELAGREIALDALVRDEEGMQLGVAVAGQPLQALPHPHRSTHITGRHGSNPASAPPT